MTSIRAFAAVRPATGFASEVASPPYDVMDRDEACAMAQGRPNSFLHVVRAEIDLPEAAETAPEVYAQGRAALRRLLDSGVLVRDKAASLYLYRLSSADRHQTGVVATVSVEDYLNGKIIRHELTREAKEADRARHFDSCDAHTAPILMTYREKPALSSKIADLTAQTPADCDFWASDGVRHEIWRLANPEVVDALIRDFASIPAFYIADGHHRAASAVRVSRLRREENPLLPMGSESDYFMAALFPDTELHILPYYRLVKDLGNYSPADFLAALQANFVLTGPFDEAVQPEQKGNFGLYLDGRWYRLDTRKEKLSGRELLERLDVTLLQELMLEPLLGIKDYRRDSRIDFVGGIRGLGELERRCHEDMRLAISTYPTSMAELLAAADAGKIMPPKSTWFEPKLRSGLLVHMLDTVAGV